MTSSAMLALAASAFVGVTVNANDNNDRVELTGQVPSWATPASATGQVSLTAPLGINVYLRSRDAAGASQLALSVSSPASSDYQQYLSPEQYRARFAPTADDVAAVATWLRSEGLTVGASPANNLYVPAGGTAAQVQAAFGTTLQRYTVSGETRQAPSKAVTVPRALAGKILGVSGLATPRKNQSRIAEPPPGGFRNAPPCSTYWAEKIATDKPQAYGAFQPVTPCGLIPAQLQGAYGVANAIKNGIDGRGVTVAITDAYAAPTILFDANTYASRHGQAPFRSGQFQQIVSPTFNSQDICFPQGWYGEETLDVEAVHAMAPGANVLYLGAASCFDTDLIAALNTIIDNHLAQIITNSWGSTGEPAADDPILAVYEETFRQAAITGIGIFFSSGDLGDDIVATGGVRTTDYPASDPWVTAVGGTSLAVTKDNGYLFETGWGTTSSSLRGGAWKPTPPGGFLYASGGGTSQVFAQPAYQEGVVPSSISRYFNHSGPAFRAVPDIAAVGDPQTGMLIGETQTFPEGVSYDEFRIGGTSLSSPIMAGIEALADQVQGQAHGFANPAIYSLPDAAFHDIVNPDHIVAVVRANYANGVDAGNGIVYRLRTMNQTGTIFTRPGYDDVTGRGTPLGEDFLRAMADLGHHGGGGGNN